MFFEDLLKKRKRRPIEVRRLRRNRNKIRNKTKSRVKLLETIPEKITSKEMLLLTAKIITSTRKVR